MQGPEKRVKPKRFLTPFESQTLKDDAAGLRARIESKEIENKDDARAALKRTIAHQEACEAPELTPEQRDKSKRQIEALESQLRDGLLSSEEMRRNPHGAVSRNLRWEKKNASIVTRWRNHQKALYRGMPQHEMADLCNVDRLRPRTSSLPMTDCQIPQEKAFSHPSEQYKANYDDIDWGGAEPQKTKHEELFESMSEEELEAATAPEPTPPISPASVPQFGDLRNPKNREKRDAWVASMKAAQQ